jgi:tetratricopeptide (TPR) repeat protein
MDIRRLGNSYGNLGDYENQLECDKKCLAIQLKLYGENSTEVASNYESIGWVYGKLGNHKQALEEYQKSLSIQQIFVGEINDKHLGRIH